MKHFVFFALRCAALLAICPASVQAQSPGRGLWCPPGAQWTYTTTVWGSIGELRVSYRGDTVVAGQSCQVLRHEMRDSSTPAFSGGHDVLTRADADRVWVYANGQFYLLYDFTAQPGATWSTWPTMAGYPCSSTTQVRVDSVGQQFFGGRLRRWFKASGFAHSRIYEGIGVTGGYLMASAIGTPCWLSEPIGVFGPRCFQTAVGLVVGNCSPLATPSVTSPTGFMVYPNPATRLLHVQTPAPGTTSWCQLHDLTGRLMLRQQLPATGLLALPALPAGFYVLTVAQAGKGLFRQQIVLE